MMRIMTEPDVTQDVVVVRESRLQRDGVYGFLTLAFIAALVRGVLGATTSGGTVGAGVVFGVLIVVVVAGWVRAIRSPDRLEVSASLIRYVPASGAPRQVSRQGGDELRFVTKRAGRLAFPSLFQSATATTLPLRWFTHAAVRTACESKGWRFVATGAPLPPS